MRVKSGFITKAISSLGSLKYVTLSSGGTFIHQHDRHVTTGDRTNDLSITLANTVTPRPHRPIRHIK